jgi:hypothetical protein
MAPTASQIRAAAANCDRIRSNWFCVVRTSLNWASGDEAAAQGRLPRPAIKHYGYLNDILAGSSPERHQLFTKPISGADAELSLSRPTVWAHSLIRPRQSQTNETA